MMILGICTNEVHCTCIPLYYFFFMTLPHTYFYHILFITYIIVLHNYHNDYSIHMQHLGWKNAMPRKPATKTSDIKKSVIIQRLKGLIFKSDIPKGGQG